MKTVILKALALVLVLSCTLTLTGCFAQKPQNRLEQEPAADEVVEVLGVPGTYDLPAVEVFALDYESLCRLSWDSTEVREQENGTWVFATEAENASFTFVFKGEPEEMTAKAAYLTVDDLAMASNAYITQELILNMGIPDCPQPVRDNFQEMDGGWLSVCELEGVGSQLMFIGDMDDEDAAYLVCVQFRRES